MAIKIIAGNGRGEALGVVAFIAVVFVVALVVGLMVGWLSP